MKYQKHCFQSVGSTNDVAADKRYNQGDIIVAEHQSEGRGQRGNRWQSESGRNLMFSLVVCPTHIRVNSQFFLSMATAVAVAKTVESYGVAGVQVKWPNDIYVEKSKICGILIEHSFSTEMLARTIIGVGINVEQTRFDITDTNPTSLALLGVTTTVDEVLNRFCDHFTSCYSLPINDLHKLYVGNLYLYDGRYHPFRDDKGDFQAKITAIDPHTGLLSVERMDGKVSQYYFKEVSYL